MTIYAFIIIIIIIFSIFLYLLASCDPAWSALFIWAHLNKMIIPENYEITGGVSLENLKRLLDVL